MGSMRMQPHRLPAARTVDAIVLPAERDAGVVGCNGPDNDKEVAAELVTDDDQGV